MRDHPNNKAKIVGGEWGANNYVNFTRSKELKTELFNISPEHRKGFDQDALALKVWPIAR